MAIEGIAISVVAKELAAKAAVEAAKQIAQKMAAELASGGLENQQLALERQAAQEDFRVGELFQPQVQELERLKDAERVSADEIAQNMDSGYDRRDAEDSGAGEVHSSEGDGGERGPVADVDEVLKTGGTYGELKNDWGGRLEDAEPPREIHHMPPDSVNGLERDDGPAIVMEKADHRQTASCGSSREAREYRAVQEELIKTGKFEDAMQMDIEDLHNKFGDKYDNEISQMKDTAKEKGLI